MNSSLLDSMGWPYAGYWGMSVYSEKKAHVANFILFRRGSYKELILTILHHIL